MAEQNFKNHTRLVPLFHFVAYPLAGFALVTMVINFFKAVSNNQGLAYPAAMVSLALALVFTMVYARSFALYAQDRAIRAEENLRHFALTGKLLDKRLRMRHIIALRFASDEEFVALAKKAAEENMSSKDIKAAIQNWRVDYHRV
jgi:Family of unknown function (DUF6526)